MFCCVQNRPQELSWKCATVDTTHSAASGGGGTGAGPGENFQDHPFTGTFTASFPIFSTPCRDAEPQLKLEYSSLGGNGVFGIGFSLGLAAISRRTRKRLPAYDADDVYVLAGGDELVPWLEDISKDTDKEGKWRRVKPWSRQEDGVNYRVTPFRTRIEGKFARIERWVRIADESTDETSVGSENAVSDERNALVKPRRRLDVETGDEMKQSLPSDWQLGQLKQSKQLLKAESAEIEAIPMTVHRAWLERRAH
jgi:hypothetical protein